ncbi:MAG: DUF4270 domain-containing protein [Bacteroidota bacterium]
MARVARFLLFITLTASCFTACKDPDELGLEVLPGSDQLNLKSTDTITILTRTVREDTLRSDELSTQLVGSYIDPDFGIAEAVAYSQVLLQGTPNFSAHAVTDSLVLRLFYKGYYGDTNTQQMFYVHRLTEDMSIDSVYYSNRSFNFDNVPLGTLAFDPRPNTRVVVDSDTVAPQIRIRLSQVLADSIIALNGSEELSTNEDWIKYFKGIRLSTNTATVPGKGCISYFDLFNSRLTLYYRDTVGLSKSYTFALTGAKSNKFMHDFTGTQAERHLLDSSYTDSLISIQAMAGLKTRFDFPYLDNLKDNGNILVNRAELKVTLKSGTFNSFPAPSSLLIVAIDSAGTGTYFPADYFESGNFFGGGLSGQTYTFNLTRQIGRILSGQAGNYGFYLVVSGSSIQASRAILGSGENATYPMKLNIYYTPIP